MSGIDDGMRRFEEKKVGAWVDHNEGPEVRPGVFPKEDSEVGIPDIANAGLLIGDP